MTDIFWKNTQFIYPLIFILTVLVVLCLAWSPW